MNDVIGALLILAVPFLLGIWVGVEIVRRREPSTDELLGQIVRERMVGVYANRRWIGDTDSLHVSSAFEISLPEQRKLQVIVREVLP